MIEKRIQLLAPFKGQCIYINMQCNIQVVSNSETVLCTLLSRPIIY
jgi:hypothetical protein